MKKTILLMVLSGLFIFGCKKKDDVPALESTEKFKATFSVSDFEISAGTLGKTNSTSAVGDTLKNHSKYLYYFIYNTSTNSLVKSIIQTSAMANFGTITDSLPAGTYTAVFASSQDELTFAGTSQLSTITMSKTQPSWSDTFLKKISFTVSGNVNQSVRLDRIVSAVEVTIEDALPERIAEVILSTANDANTFNISTETASLNISSSKKFIISNQDIGKTNKKFFMYILNTSGEFPLTVRYLVSPINTDPTVPYLLTEETVSGVRCYRNKKTLLSGKLLNPAGFTVNISTTWETPIVPVYEF